MLFVYFRDDLFLLDFWMMNTMNMRRTFSQTRLDLIGLALPFEFVFTAQTNESRAASVLIERSV